MTTALTQTRALLDALQTEGGFTWDPRRHQRVHVGDRVGYMIAVPGTERLLAPGSMTAADLETALAEMGQAYAQLGKDAYVGGWYSPERDAYMIEVSKIFDISREAAVRLGHLRGQEAIFDIGTGEEIDLRPVYAAA
jgi:hypothetical protein